jgi:hypothetical protein
MTMFLDTFHVPHTLPPLQIIHDDGPPKPEQHSRRTHFKTLINEDRSRYNAEQKNEGNVAPTSDGVELSDFIYLSTYSYSWRDEFGVALYGD